MDSGTLINENKEVEQNINQEQTDADIDAQIEILASVIIEILLKDIK